MIFWYTVFPDTVFLLSGSISDNSRYSVSGWYPTHRFHFICKKYWCWRMSKYGSHLDSTVNTGNGNLLDLARLLAVRGGWVKKHRRSFVFINILMGLCGGWGVDIVIIWISDLGFCDTAWAEILHVRCRYMNILRAFFQLMTSTQSRDMRFHQKAPPTTL